MRYGFDKLPDHHHFLLFQQSFHENLFLGKFAINFLLNFAFIIVGFTARLLVLFLVVILVEGSILRLDWGWWLKDNVDLHHFDQKVGQRVIAYVFDQFVKCLTFSVQENVSESAFSLFEKQVPHNAKEVSAGDWEQLRRVSLWLRLLLKSNVSAAGHQVNGSGRWPTHVVAANIQV